MVDVVIYIRGVFSDLPTAVADSNGYVTFDLKEDYSFAETLTANGLTVENLFLDDIVVSESMPNTPKNTVIFNYFKNKEIPVLVMSGGRPMPFKALTATNFSAKDKTTEVQIKSENPLRLMQEAKINDVDLGTINSINTNELFSLWQNTVADTAWSYYLPVVDYGLFTSSIPNTETIVLAENLRPLIRSISLVKALFAKHGWSVNCPLYEIEPFSKVGDYLTTEWTGDSFLKQFSARAIVKKEQTITYPNFLKFDTEGDIEVNYNEPFLKFREKVAAYGSNYMAYNNGGGTLQFTGMSGTFKLSFFIIAKNVLSRLFLRAYKNNFQEDYAIQIGGSGSYSPNFQDDIEYELKPNDTLYVNVSAADLEDFGTIGAGSMVTLTCQEYKYRIGSIEPVAKFIEPSIKPVDYIKAFMHRCNMLMDLNFSTRTANFYPPFAVANLMNSGITTEGYYVSRGTDMRANQIWQSEQEISEITPVSKTQIVRWKSSTDPNLSSQENLFEKRITIEKEGAIDEETIYENPLFEPTKTVLSSIGLNGTNPVIAQMTDNEDGELSYNIGARTVIFENRKPNGFNGTQTIWRFKETQESTTIHNISAYMPTCYMLPPSSYSSYGINHNLCFDNGKNDNQDLYSLFFDKLIKQTLLFKKANILFYFKNRNDAYISMRHAAYVMINGKTKKCIVTQKKDIRHNAQLSIPYELIVLDED